MKQKGRKTMENKDMENLKSNEMEKTSGGGLPTFPLPEEFMPACPRCGSKDVTELGVFLHCEKCGYSWKPLV